MGILKKDIFGQYLFIKKGIIRTMGVLIYPRFNWINKTKIEGAEILKPLATVIVFGLSFSLLVSLILIPMLYLIFHKEEAEV